mmetsp:Transcript_66476/g.144903  ORF Transcript_66476/g.144903 Transcript_66476/m.144903 type:complete len:291 (+) Transcript_66476:51-923(+)
MQIWSALVVAARPSLGRCQALIVATRCPHSSSEAPQMKTASTQKRAMPRLVGRPSRPRRRSESPLGEAICAVLVLRLSRTGRGRLLHTLSVAPQPLPSVAERPCRSHGAALRVPADPTEGGVHTRAATVFGATGKLVDVVLLKEALHRADVPVPEVHVPHRPPLGHEALAAPTCAKRCPKASAVAKRYRDDGAVLLPPAEERFVVGVPSNSVGSMVIKVQIDAIWEATAVDAEVPEPSQHHEAKPTRHLLRFHLITPIPIGAAAAARDQPSSLARDLASSTGELPPLHIT